MLREVEPWFEELRRPRAMVVARLSSLQLVPYNPYIFFQSFSIQDRHLKHCGVDVVLSAGSAPLRPGAGRLLSVQLRIQLA